MRPYIGWSGDRTVATPYRCIHRGADYELGHWRCEHPEQGLHESERAAAYEVVFPIGGAFTREIRGRRHFADATRVLFANRDDVYRVAHPVPGGDECTVLTMSDRLVEDIAGATDALVADGDSGLAFRALSCPVGGRLYRAHRRVSRDAARGDVDGMAVAEAVYALLDATIRAGHGPYSRPVRPRTRRRRQGAVERAIAAIHAGFRRRLTLAGLAREAGYSEFHFTRLFRERTGLTVHRYVDRLRLRSAMEAVLDGAPDLTTVAFRHGFSSHSHFTRAFRREYGATPSMVRASAR
ncbi:MAG: helix-turn-helix transcriptional regulator [Gemmatimonadota bacterium]